jgi:fatty acid desaturase
MRPEIEAYLRKNGARYTTKSLRLQLHHAGYDPAEVDAALLETEAERASQLAQTQLLRTRFWTWAFVLNAITLALVVFWVAIRGNSSFVPLVIVILGIFLLIGIGISGLIGRAFLDRGMGIALIAPILFAVVLGGTCAAMMSGRVL